MKYKLNISRQALLQKLRWKKRWYRTAIIVAGIIATVIVAFNFWFTDHAAKALEQLVYTQSKGKMILKMSGFKFNWINNRIELRDAALLTTDTTAPSLTQFKSKKIIIKAKGFLPLLFDRSLLIDSIRLQNPDIAVIKINEKVPKLDTAEFSVAKELGRVTKSINEAIQMLQIDRFSFNDGRFSLIDKTLTHKHPFIVTNININLSNLQISSKENKKGEKTPTLLTDNIDIQTNNQNIIFPDGRHSISFKRFSISLANKRVTFDSCTLRGVKGDSSKTAFKIFFDKLRMSNINFDTLYHAEAIKADSVYCINPDIFLDIDGDKISAKKNKKKIQNIDELLQQLVGDVMLEYVIIKNANLNINTIKHGKTNTYFFAKNDFAMEGLNIRKEAAHPLQVKRFYMNVKDYATTLQDGRYAIAFDSIFFENDAITLHRFSFKEFDKGIAHKNVNMQLFELRGLSWESLLYDNVFKAASAHFYTPTIVYTAGKNKPWAAKSKTHKSIFETLGEVGQLINLSDLTIHNGNILLHLNKGAHLQLQQTNLSLYPDELTASKKIKNVQHAVRHLHVKKGIFTKGSTRVVLNDLSLIENNNGISTSGITVHAPTLNAQANGVVINNILLDSSSHTIAVTGLQWRSATLAINKSVKKEKKQTATQLVLKNIAGNNTRLRIHTGDKEITALIHFIQADEVAQTANGKLRTSGLHMAGEQVTMLSPQQQLRTASFRIRDNAESSIKNISYRKTGAIDSISIDIPLLTFVPHISPIINGTIALQRLVLSDPVITATLGQKDSSEKKAAKPPPVIQLGSAFLQRPKIHLTIINKNNLPSYVTWNGVKENSYVSLTDFASTPAIPVLANTMKIYLTHFEFVNTKGKRTATNDNKLNLEFDKLRVQKNHNNKIEWSTIAHVISLDKLYFDSLGKNNAVLKLNQGDVRNIALHSNYVNTIGDIIMNSHQLQIRANDGSFYAAKNQMHWYNLSFKNGYFQTDSFSLHPHQTIEAYRTAKAFDEDYLTLHTGKITGGPFDAVRYGRDTILSIGGVQVNDMNLITFKDKTQADTTQKIKPLPVALIRSIPTKLNIDSLQMKNMYVEYWELNAKTDTMGIIPVSNLNVAINNIKNHHFKANDSLYIEASAQVIHALRTHLKVAAPYNDTSGTFLMQLHTGPMDLTRFNSIIKPLIAARAASGDLEQIQLQAMGNNNYAIGQMQMFYKNLNLQLLNKKNLEAQSFLNKIMSWVANTFIIRTNNAGKKSPVFFERIKEKSAINFLIKTTLSGIKSSIGVPGTKGKQRRYFRKNTQYNRS